jgi:hypothetical protein
LVGIVGIFLGSCHGLPGGQFEKRQLLVRIVLVLGRTLGSGEKLKEGRPEGGGVNKIGRIVVAGARVAAIGPEGEENREVVGWVGEIRGLGRVAAKSSREAVVVGRGDDGLFDRMGQRHGVADGRESGSICIGERAVDAVNT